MSMLDAKKGEGLANHITSVSAKLEQTEPGTEKYDQLLDEYHKLYNLSVNDEVKEYETGEKTLSREDIERNNIRQAELKEKELEEKRLAREDMERNNIRQAELKEKELEEKRLARESEERNNVRQAELKEKELEEKRLSRENEKKRDITNHILTALQITAAVAIPIATAAFTKQLMIKCGEFETGDNPNIFTTLTSKQVVNAIGKGVGVKTK